MSEQEPRIFYGDLEQPIHTNGQYLLMKAGITNGEYSSGEFIEKINSVSLDEIRTEEGRRDVHNQRLFLQQFSKLGDKVTIKDFYPDEGKIEKFVNTTFAEMHAGLQKRSRGN